MPAVAPTFAIAPPAVIGTTPRRHSGRARRALWSVKTRGRARSGVRCRRRHGSSNRRTGRGRQGSRFDGPGASCVQRLAASVRCCAAAEVARAGRCEAIRHDRDPCGPAPRPCLGWARRHPGGSGAASTCRIRLLLRSRSASRRAARTRCPRAPTAAGSRNACRRARAAASQHS